METTDAPMLPSVVLADDISGAAEVAATFGSGTRVLLGVPTGGFVAIPSPHVTVIDTDTRASGPEYAGRAVADAVSSLDRRFPLVKKVDSLLRGNVSAELAPLLRTGWLVVLAPALPELGRTTTAGVIEIDGVPLHSTDLWLAEPLPAPRSIAEVLGDLPHQLLNLDDVRNADLTKKLREMRGQVAVCDAESIDDLAVIARAAVQIPAVAIVGSSALCRVLAEREQPAHLGSGLKARRHCLTVVGTASPAAREQARHLAEDSPVTWIELAVDELVDGTGASRQTAADRISDGLVEGDVLVTLESITSDGHRPAGPALTKALADIVSRSSVRTAAGPKVDLILTGGETARAVLDALGVGYLDVVGQTEPGAVVSSTANGARVGTRPGSFGGPGSLTTLRRSLWAHPNKTSKKTYKYKE